MRVDPDNSAFTLVHLFFTNSPTNANRWNITAQKIPINGKSYYTRTISHCVLCHTYGHNKNNCNLLEEFEAWKNGERQRYLDAKKRVETINEDALNFMEGVNA
jgi:hypothetical protein